MYSEISSYMYNWGERSEPCTSEVNANSVYLYVFDRPVALRMRRNMLSTCCSCARPTNALHSPSRSIIIYKWTTLTCNTTLESTFPPTQDSDPDEEAFLGYVVELVGRSRAVSLHSRERMAAGGLL